MTHHAAQDSQEHTGFREARRELTSLTASAEKRLLLRLAARVPAGIGPDHLTGLGLFGMLLGGLCYALAGERPTLLLAANLGLALNWLGDSLDGTLARYRRRERPRYGFYVDHVIDALGIAALLIGLGFSGYMSSGVAAALLVAYYLLTIDVSLATYALGRFRISFGALGGTELRLLLAGVNVIVFLAPRLSLFGTTFLVFDVLGLAAAVGLLLTTLTSILGNARELQQLEGT